MRRIRLQINILPWSNPTSPTGSSASLRQEKILPWTEPCDEDVTIQELSERIVLRFANIHKGKGLLNIRYILNYWDSIQDGPLTVGDCFDNPSNTGDISSSVVKVARFPPTPRELDNQLRFASIIPESTARPQKRRYEHLIQPLAQSPSPQPSREVENINPDWGSGQLIDGHGVANKRRKIRDRGTDDYGALDQPTVSCGGLGDEDQYHLHSVPRHLSPSIQVVDSQRSLARKQNNPYDTPSSVSLASPLGLTSFSHVDKLVPDSPPSRHMIITNTSTKANFEYEPSVAKAESPELGLSVHEVPLSTMSAEKTTLTEGLRENFGSLPLSTINRARGNSVDHIYHPGSPGGRDLSQAQKADFPGQIPDTMATLTSPKTGLVPHHVNSSRLSSKDIFDPIETDSDNSHQLPKLNNVKRLKDVSKPISGTELSSREGNSNKTPKSLADVVNSFEVSSNVAHSHPESQISQLQSRKKEYMMNGHDMTENEQRLNTTGKGIDSCEGRVRLRNEIQLLPQTSLVQARHSSNSLDNPLLPTGGKGPLLSAKEIKKVIASQSQQTQQLEPIKEPEDLMEIDHGTSWETIRSINSTQQEASKMQLANEQASKTKFVEEAQRVILTKEEEIANKKNLAKDQARKLGKVENLVSKVKVVHVEEHVVKLDKAQAKKTMQATKLIEKLEPSNSRENETSSRALEKVKAKGNDVENSSRKELAEGKRLSKKPITVGEQKKAIEQQTSQIDCNSNDRLKVQKTEQGTVVVSIPNTTKFMNKPTPKPQKSEKPMNPNPVTPSARRFSDRSRRSMTPAFPQPISKIKVEPMCSYPTPLKESATSKTPMRSSLKRNSSSVRHSVSFIDLDASDAQVSTNVTTQMHKQDKEFSSSTKSNEAKRPKESKSVSGSSKAKPEASTDTGTKKVAKIKKDTGFKKDTGTKKDTVIKKDSSVTRDVGAKNESNSKKGPIFKTEKKQTKLKNMAIDRKMKGRVIDPPSPLKPALQQEIVLSSDDEGSVSSFYSDDDIVKAGPSAKRKPISRASKSSVSPKQGLASITSTLQKAIEIGEQQTFPTTSADKISEPNHKASNPTRKTGKPNIRSPPAIPAPQVGNLGKEPSLFVNLTAGEPEATKPPAHNSNVHKEQSSPFENKIDPQILFSTPCPGPSSPRIPAQYMSKPVSISSGSGSGTESKSEYESGSEDDSTTSTTETRPEEIQENGSCSKGLLNGAKDVEMIDADTVPISHGETSLQRSQKSSNGLQLGDAQRTEHEAPSIIKKVASANQATPTSNPSIIKNRFPSSSLRSTSRFTSLTDLKNEKFRRPENRLLDPKMLASSKSKTFSQVSSSSNSSSSDESSSSDDDDSDAFSTRSPATATQAVQKANKSRSRPHKGVGRLVKLLTPRNPKL